MLLLVLALASVHCAVAQQPRFTNVVVDGQLNDWTTGAVTRLTDPAGDGRPHDLRAAWLGEDRFRFYVAATAAGAFPVDSAHFNILFDTDNNANTGFRMNGMGGDILYQHRALWEHVGEAGTWEWQRIPSCAPWAARGTNNRVLELGIAKVCLGSPARMRVVMLMDVLRQHGPAAGPGRHDVPVPVAGAAHGAPRARLLPQLVPVLLRRRL